MRPPELHVVLIGLGRQALGVDKVQKSTVFLVPTGADGVVEDGLRLFDEFRLAELLLRTPAGTTRPRYRDQG